MAGHLRTLLDVVKAPTASPAGDDLSVRLRAFWTAFTSKLGLWWETEIDTDKFYDAAIAAGLMERVVYDPGVHGLMHEECEPGDEIIVFTDAGKAALAAPAPFDGARPGPEEGMRT